MQHLSERSQLMEVPMTLEMSKKSRELAAQGHDVINLSLGEPDFDTPVFIKEAAKKAIDDNYSHYTPVAGYLDLREAISKKFLRDNGLKYAPNQIVVSTGAKQSLANVVLALINPGDEVIIPAPYWVSYIEQVKLAGGIPVVIETDLSSGFKITADELRNAMTEKSKLMIFSSPCNPSGAVYSHSELKELADVIAEKTDFFVMSDEIYELINYTGSHTSLASFQHIYNQVITVNGLSKGFAMTGWRLGYIGAPTWLAKACDDMQSQFTSATCSIAQRAAIDAVLADPTVVNYMVEEFRKRKELMLRLMATIPGFKLYNPDGAFYLFIDVKEVLGKKYKGEWVSTDLDLSMYLLNVAHVSSVPGSAFGSPGYIRFSFAASEDNLIVAAKRVKQAIENLEA